MKEKYSLAKNTIIGVVKNDQDLGLVIENKIYRIPESAVGNSISKKALESAYSFGFYQTQNVRNGLPSSIEFFGTIAEIDFAQRKKYLADKPEKQDEFYYFVKFHEIENLQAPILVKGRRRITFVRTNHDLMLVAEDFNDLIIGNKSEEIFFEKLKNLKDEFNSRTQLNLERKYYMNVGGESVLVDFAIFNNDKNVGILIDEEENLANNDNNKMIYSAENQAVQGNRSYSILRFSPADIESDLATCMSKIHKALIT